MSLKISYNYSPNFSTYKRNVKFINYIIIHYTGMKSEVKAIKRLTDEKSKVSCHYFIKNNGDIIQMVPDRYISWHVGKSRWKRLKLLNRFSIGIEIQNNGHQNGYNNFKKKQINKIIKLLKIISKKYNIKKENILGHSDVSYDRKKDPGEKFPWEILAKNKLGLWHNIMPSKLRFFRMKELNKKDTDNFFLNLKKIGYYLNNSKSFRKKLVIAFQRRFRNKLVNGILDQECLIISKKLSKSL